MRRMVLVAMIGGIFALGCSNGTPTAPAPAARMATSPSVAQSAGVQKTTISGTIELVSVEPPEKAIVTPSGMIHVREMPEHTQFTGDVVGPVTFHAAANRSGDRTHLVSRGPFDGEVTFQGRTGLMTGQWTTNCKWDEALGNVSCGGIMNARGEGDLEGVQFHFEWGPGWWPFSYTGTAYARW